MPCATTVPAETVATPRHVALIMDGNGRWAQRRGLPRGAGHRQGAKALSPIIEAAAERGVKTLTLYAFSSDNWGRPQAEVKGLLALMQRYLNAEAERCRDRGIQLNIIGRRDRLPDDLLEAIEDAEALTSCCSCDRMLLRIAVDYSSRESLLAAAQALYQGDYANHSFEDTLAMVMHSVSTEDRVDLLIRTGGEKRLSDFLLWECAYAELYFTDTLWPDFGRAGLLAALEDFSRRQRRFGKLPETATA